MHGITCIPNFDNQSDLSNTQEAADIILLPEGNTLCPQDSVRSLEVEEEIGNALVQGRVFGCELEGLRSEWPVIHGKLLAITLSVYVSLARGSWIDWKSIFRCRQFKFSGPAMARPIPVTNHRSVLIVIYKVLAP